MFSNSSNYCCTTIFEEQDHVLTLRSLEHHVLPFGNNNDQLGKTGEVGGGGGGGCCQQGGGIHVQYLFLHTLIIATW